MAIAVPDTRAPCVVGARPRRAARTHLLAVVLAVFAVGSAALIAVHHPTRLPLARAAAIRDALREAPRALPRQFSRVELTPIDGRLEQVSFYRGARLVYEAAVQADGRVRQEIDFLALGVPYGNWFGYMPGVLVGLVLLFTLATAVVPIWRLRNLDVGVVAALAAPMVLLQRRYVGASVLVAAAALGYLAIRCASLALLGSRPVRPSRPLFEVLTPGWSEVQRIRVLRITLGAAALAFFMIGVGSTDAVDVIYAVMEGATKLVHGVLPYGHLPGDVIHGDTYPILSYALYAPFALIAPVNSIWDSVDIELGLAALAALVAGAGVVAAACRPRRERCCEEELAALRLALAWLSFPPLVVTVSTGTTDVVLAAMVIWALALWRRPVASSTLVALAGWFKLAPFALLPLWLARLRGRPLWGALAGALVVSGAALAIVVWLGGMAGVGAMVHGIGYQFSRGAFQSPLHSLGAEWLQPPAEAAVLAFLAGGCLQVRGDPRLARDPRRIAALAAAILIGVQLSADYWSFLYLTWAAPFVLVALIGARVRPHGIADASPRREGAEAPRAAVAVPA